MRRPETISKTRRTFSRQRKAMVMSVVPPISLPPDPTATAWEAMRFSSMSSTRMTVAFSGTSSVMPRSFSTARA